MDIDLTDEQQAILRICRELGEKEIAPGITAWEDEGVFPGQLFQHLGQLGLTGMLVPQEFGGAGMDRVTVSLVLQELARSSVAVASYLSVHNMVAALVYKYGNDNQRRRYLPAMASGEKLGAFALTEPGAGSDASALTTSARRENGHFTLNGSKIFITGGGEARVYLVMARTGSPGPGGISALLVEKDTPGFSFGKKEIKMGLNSSPTRELVFTDCRVPTDNLLGEEGKGFAYAMEALDGGRINIGSCMVGLASAALDEAVKYARQRQQFGRMIADFQGIQFMLADMAMELEASRQLVHQAALRADRGLPVTEAAAMAKCYATDAAMKITTDAVQVLGGYGYTREFPVERYMREAKLGQIVEGTNQIQRIVIARSLLNR